MLICSNKLAIYPLDLRAISGHLLAPISVSTEEGVWEQACAQLYSSVSKRSPVLLFVVIDLLPFLPRVSLRENLQVSAEGTRAQKPPVPGGRSLSGS